MRCVARQARSATARGRGLGASRHASSGTQVDQPDPGPVLERHEFVVHPRDVLSADQVRMRLDAYLSKMLPGASRARLVSCIRSGLVGVNGAPPPKPSTPVRAGDVISCGLAPLPASRALPQDIPLDIVYEDAHLLVLNKAAGIVVHPSAGHADGTLVNALLHHCGVRGLELEPGHAAPTALLGGAAGAAEDAEDEDDDSDVEDEVASLLGDGGGALRGNGAGDTPGVSLQNHTSHQPGVIRPGIVHRLDKGTTGLLVVAKTEAARVGLVEQFRARTVQRLYLSVTLNTPHPARGRLETNVGRDCASRMRMATFAAASSRGRLAISTWAVERELAGGGAALTRWRLGTGRTHQIRVHARHLGCPLLGDEAYGGGAGASGAALGRGRRFLTEPGVRASC
ncbi:hypothetical protein ACKKBG_A28780 [Auxenochlorella protothecoides x Auxenochlorella symbiontica]